MIIFGAAQAAPVFLLFFMKEGAVFHEGGNVHMFNAISLLDHVISGNQILGVVVWNLFQRGIFSVFGFRTVHNGHSDLYIGISCGCIP